MKRVNFPSSIDYAAYVNSRITVGMLVRSSPGAIDFEESDTGTVRRIHRGGIHDVQVNLKQLHFVFYFYFCICFFLSFLL